MGSEMCIRDRIDLEAPGLPQGFTGIAHGNSEFMRATDLHPVHAALTYSDRPGRLLCTLMNSCPHPVAVSKGQAYGLLREAKSNREDFYNPWAIQFIEGSLSPIEGLPEASPEEQEQADALEQKRRRQWLVDQFRINESPFIQGRPERLEKALTLLLNYYDLFSQGDKYGRTTLVEHEICTQDVPPIKTKGRPYSDLKCRYK